MRIIGLAEKLAQRVVALAVDVARRGVVEHLADVVDTGVAGRIDLEHVDVAPLRDLEETRKELKFGKEHGACGIFVRGLELEMRLVNRYFYKLYEMAQEGVDLKTYFAGASH